ncbi:TetR/AcrR family transcriptional regulator [Amycolatopsis circi]|uniref:TetR/AcrR family transcriptional regulator n=1 Tax=Amycolatopsis circi TaxID=871959 RepID=UPI0013BE9BA0|nr:TetR/AcrR family transcriptional regulator [Amycolatopsis circi]
MTTQDTHAGRDGAAKPQLTRKGAATRARLIRSAHEVFARSGFLDTKITDITAAAGSANGTFYVYFDSKETIFKAVVDEVIGDFLATLRAGRPREADPVAVIAHDNRRYVQAYRKHADIMRVIEQVATFNEEFASLRRSIRERFVARAARGIQTWQEQGHCTPEFSARTIAGLLVSMVDNFTYNWLSLGHEYSEAEADAAMTDIWVRALGLERPS